MSAIVPTPYRNTLSEWKKVLYRQITEKLLDNENLICLCRMHHRLADSGEISQEYLKKLAQKREQT